MFFEWRTGELLEACLSIDPGRLSEDAELLLVNTVSTSATGIDEAVFGQVEKFR